MSGCPSPRAEGEPSHRGEECSTEDARKTDFGTLLVRGLPPPGLARRQLEDLLPHSCAPGNTRPTALRRKLGACTLQRSIDLLHLRGLVGSALHFFERRQVIVVAH